jgi:hypothetical protein
MWLLIFRIHLYTSSTTNKPIFDRTFGHFIRVLVDMELKIEPKYKILVERTIFSFIVGIEYENMHDFYNHFNYIRHHVSYCKRVKVAPTQEEHELINKREPRQVHRKAFVQTKDDMKVQNKETEIIN